MNRAVIFFVSLLMLLSVLLQVSRIDSVEVKSINDHSVHNLNTNLNYTTIQAAIDANETLDGHTIFVEEGIYYEHLVIDKAVSLVGENRGTTIVDGNGTGITIVEEYNITAVVYFATSNTEMSSFTVRNGGHQNRKSGLALISKENCTLKNVVSTGSFCAIFLINSSHNHIIDCTGRMGYTGIMLYNSTENRIIRSTFSSLYCGIAMVCPEGFGKNLIANNTITFCTAYGMDIVGHNNTICQNNISYNSQGIILDMADHNKVCENSIYNNTIFGVRLMSGCIGNILTENTIRESGSCGLYIEYGTSSFIYHNNFVSNYLQAYSGDLASFGNVWDDGLEGNYWDDYRGRDEDADGLGDTGYKIYEYDRDNHPLMGMFSDFNASSDYHVQTICNSSISDFQFNGTAVSFNVAGQDATVGFCRICIPTALMNDSFRVFVNGTEILPPPEPLPCSNNTHNYLYFAYNHSMQQVVIIPEFPSPLILPLLMTTTMLIVEIHGKRPLSSKKQ